MRATYLASLFLSLMTTSSLAKQRCSHEVSERAVAQVRTQQNILLKQQVEEMSTDIAPSLRSHILVFKNALAEAIDAEMACIPEARKVRQSKLGWQNYWMQIGQKSRSRHSQSPLAKTSSNRMQYLGLTCTFRCRIQRMLRGCGQSKSVSESSAV
jgi:hypothetical protein